MNDQVLHLAKSYHPAHGGMETATKDLAETAVGLGLSVGCRAFGTVGFTGRYVVQGVSVRAYRPIATVRSAPLSAALFATRLKNVALVHLHLPNPLMEARLLISLLIFPKLRSRCVPFFHAFPLRQGRLGRAWFKLVTGPILARCPRVLVSDARIVECFPQLRPWRAKFVEMPFAADAITEPEWEALRDARLRAGSVLAIGRLVGYKGFDVLLAAWRKIEDDPDLARFRLSIVGSGPEGERLREIARRLGLQRVDFLGPVSDARKKELLRGGILLVAPSLTAAETFGISVLEAMSYGLAVSTTTLPTGLSTLARGGACGAAVEPGKVSQLAASLATMLQDPADTLERHGRANLRFVRSRFCREELSRRYRELLQSLGVI